MEDLTQYIPDDFPYDDSEAIGIVKIYQEGLAAGLKFFAVPDMYELMGVYEIMECIKTARSVVVWGPRFKDKAIGLHAYSPDVIKPSAVQYPMPDAIREQLLEQKLIERTTNE